MSNYRSIAARLARSYGLNPSIFLRQIGAESGFNPGARSPAGAVGIAQIVPRYHPDVDPSRPGNQPPGVDPVADLRYAAGRDARLLKQYGNMRDVLSAYNSGRPWAEGQKISETSNYVSKILGGASGSGGGSAAAPPPGNSLEAGADPLGGADPRRELVTSLMSSIGKHDPMATIEAVKKFKAAEQPAAATPGAGGTPGSPVTQGGGSGGLKELIYDPLGSIFDGVRSSKPYGGHDDHDHIADSNPQEMLAIIKRALATGMHVSENPYVDHVDPVHAKNSWHYKTFAGKFNGRKLGEAADVSGTPQQMAAFFRWVASHYG